MKTQSKILSSTCLTLLLGINLSLAMESMHEDYQQGSKRQRDTVTIDGEPVFKKQKNSGYSLEDISTTEKVDALVQKSLNGDQDAYSFLLQKIYDLTPSNFPSINFDMFLNLQEKFTLDVSSLKLEELYIILSSDKIQISDDYAQKIIGYLSNAPKTIEKNTNHYLLGLCFHQLKSNHIALGYITESAQNNFIKAQYTLSTMYFSRIEVEENHKLALEWCHEAALQGYAPAQNILSSLYFRGMGVEKNHKIALELCHEAALQGYASAQKIPFNYLNHLSRAYQNEPNQQQRRKTKIEIVSLVNHLHRMGKIDDANRTEVIDIAKGINAGTLAIRLEKTPSESPFSPLPKELSDYVLALVSQKSDLGQIKEMLSVNKAFNRFLQTAPIHLNLSAQNITDENLLKIVTIFPNISSLNLSGCLNITDAGLAHLQGLPISSLNLMWCANITDAGLAHLQSLPISSLDLTQCNKITDTGLTHLQSLPISSLNLSGTEIRDAGLAHLKGLPISSLNLSSCLKITDTGLTHLQSLPISFLDLWSTFITDTGLKKFQDERPNLNINR